MDNTLLTSLVKVCTALNENQVEYIIVGGTAVGFYGYSRISTKSDGSPLGKHDLDIWYNPVLTNFYRLLDAITELGINVSEHRKGVAVPKKSFFRYEFDEFKADFLPEIKGLDNFVSSFEKKVTVVIDEAEVSFVSYEDLVKSKETDSRAKDLDDLTHLRASRKRNLEEG